MRGIPSGERLFVVSLEKTMGDGVLVKSKGVLGLVCGRKSEKNGPTFSKIPLLFLGMGVGLVSGRMHGAVRRR